MAPPDPIASVRIMCHEYLSPGTILVSRDIWEIMRETYAEEGRDRSFLRAIGILTDDPPKKGSE